MAIIEIYGDKRTKDFTTKFEEWQGEVKALQQQRVDIATEIATKVKEYLAIRPKVVELLKRCTELRKEFASVCKINGVVPLVATTTGEENSAEDITTLEKLIDLDEQQQVTDDINLMQFIAEQETTIKNLYEHTLKLATMLAKANKDREQLIQQKITNYGK